jgi:flagellar protein FliS
VNGPDEYLETQVMTATPHQLHLMVVDGAIRFATQAEEALQENDFEISHFALNRSREFVTELIGGLDQERSDEIVNRLKSLFMFVYQNLVKADMKRDVSMAQDALKILKMHRETWMELGEKVKQENIPTPNENGENDWSS